MHRFFTRRIALSSVLNLRELGGYPAANGTITAYGRYWRSNALYNLSQEEVSRLQAYNLRKVIDLRSEAEKEIHPSSFADCPAIDYVPIPVLDLFPNAVFEGHFQANQIRNMSDFYKNLMQYGGEQIASVLREIAKETQGVTLFHCTAGKDRTGITAALLLGMAGVRDIDIIADYTLTDVYMFEKYEKMRQEHPDIPVQFMNAHAENMRNTLAFLEVQYGGITGYLENIGIDAKCRESLMKGFIL